MVNQNRRSIKKEKPMRKTLIATALVAVAFPAFAQQQPARPCANSDANTPAVNSFDSPVLSENHIRTYW
jgi:uncharacterized protein YdeI (BOF family)